MRRYRGESLPEDARIAVVGNDAIGNFVALTPLFQAIRREWRPARLDYWSGSRVAELAEESDLFDTFFPFLGTAPARAASWALDNPVHLVINVERSPWAKAITALLASETGRVVGPCLDEEGRGDLPFADDAVGALWSDPAWIAPDLRERYPFLRTGFIGEIFLRGCYLVGDLPPYRVPRRDPGRELPEVLVATAASLPEKLWPLESWAELLSRLREHGCTAGLVGAAPAAQGKYWQGARDEDQLVTRGLVTDLRGRLRLPAVVGALARARAVVTLDNGILHLAVAAGARTIGLYRFGIHRLWAPPSDRLTVLVPHETEPVAAISVDRVWEALVPCLSFPDRS